MTSLIPSQREPIDSDELRLLRERKTIVLDEQRRRPRYFDGRFLAARDLTREQTYFLSRQASLGQVLGSGVLSGLMVTLTATGSVSISPGIGLTPAGEMVALDDGMEVRLDAVTESERLNVAFGLRRLPQPPARARTGLYVLGLRPVEFSANPIAAYPTSLAGPRTVQDGEIVEATAVSLVPYPEEAAGEVGMRRARVAREIFVAGSTRGIPAEILPLALLALERGAVSWADPFLVRRELGAQHGDLPGLGLAPRALREAHLMQYELHLQDVLAERKQRGLSETFTATEHFLALPAAGRLPKGAVDGATFTQTFFPPELDVDLALVPNDEIPALLRDSLVLPPLDLTESPADFVSTPVLALVPVKRQMLLQLSSQIGSLTRGTQAPLPVRLARQSPAALLQGIRVSRLAAAAPKATPVSIDDLWRKALKAAPDLWFVRRRAKAVPLVLLPSEDEGPQPPEPPPPPSGDLAEKIAALGKALAALNLGKIFERVVSKKAEDDKVRGAVVVLLTSFLSSRLILGGILGELDRSGATLNQTAFDAVKARFSRSGMADLLGKIGKADPRFFEATGAGRLNFSMVGRALVEGGLVPEMAALAANLDDKKIAETTAAITRRVGNRQDTEVETELKTWLGERGGKL